MDLQNILQKTTTSKNIRSCTLTWAPMPEFHTREFDTVCGSLGNELNNNHVLTNFDI